MSNIINGFQVDITSSELDVHIDKQIAHHQTQVGKWEERVGKLQAVVAARGEVHDSITRGGGLHPRHGDEYDVEQAEMHVGMHKQRAHYLGFLQTHLIADVVYRLGEEDLIRLEFVGDFEERGALVGGCFPQLGRV